jgi:uncharacterized protein YlzI (FlbEa/FlbD family)
MIACTLNDGSAKSIWFNPHYISAVKEVAIGSVVYLHSGSEIGVRESVTDILAAIGDELNQPSSR